MFQREATEKEEFIVSGFRDLLRARRQRHFRVLLGIAGVLALIACWDLLFHIA